MIKLAICDDEKKILEDMSHKVSSLISEAEISLYNGGKKLLEDMKHMKHEGFDILLLDIDVRDCRCGVDVVKGQMNRPFVYAAVVDRYRRP